MKNYDPSKVLFYIHVPKCGGTSVQELYRNWFDGKYLLHYGGTNSQGERVSPKKYILPELPQKGANYLIYGHCNRLFNEGFVDYYGSEATQFATILRDPWDTIISEFKYTSSYVASINGNLPTFKDYLERLKYRANYINHLPREMSIENCIEKMEEDFVHVGILDYLEKSLEEQSRILSKEYGGCSIGHENKSSSQSFPIEIDQDEAENYKERFMHESQIEYKIYNYFRSKYSQE